MRGNSSKTNSLSQQAQVEEADKQGNFISGTWRKLVNYIRNQTDFAKVVGMLKENIHTLYSVILLLLLLLFLLLSSFLNFRFSYFSVLFCTSYLQQNYVNDSKYIFQIKKRLSISH